MIDDRALTPEEKDKLRAYQAAEILRRRNGDGGVHPFVEPGDETPKAKATSAPPATPACPECGTPYANPKYKRCFHCIPGSGKVRSRPVDPAALKPPPRRIGLTEAFARPEAPAPEPETTSAISEPEYEPPIPEYSVPSRKIDVSAPDHPLKTEEMVAPPARAPVPLAAAVAAIRGVVDLLAGLDDESARWVVDAAYRLSRDREGRQ